MRLSLRTMIGVSAALIPMVLVLGSTILAPAEPSETVASTCPSKMKTTAPDARRQGA